MAAEKGSERREENLSQVKQDGHFWDYYELSKCLQFIKNHKKVTLQFPDDLLHDAVKVSSLLKRESKEDVYILGDTSYGSCCVDEVGAEHIGSEGIIHFGPSCLTETKRLPVLYVFGKEDLNAQDLNERFQELFPNKLEHIIILYDVVYSHAIDSLSNEITSTHPNAVLSQLLIPSSPLVSPSDVITKGTASSSSCSDCACGNIGNRVEPVAEPEHFNGKNNDDHNIKRFGRCFDITRPLSEYKIFYIGSEGPTLTNFMLTYHNNQFYSYNPTNGVSRKESLNVNQMLRRRYYLIQKAKEANTIGILVGTLGAVNYLPMIERLKTVLKNAGKKFYTIAVGKLNPAKLANFMEVELYVIVACPQCSLLDSQEYYRPIVTPFEMEVACLKSRSWTGDIVLAYQELLPGGAYHAPPMDAEVDSDPQFSFLTGKMLPVMVDEVSTGNNDKSIATKGSGDVLLHSQSSGGSYLRSRSWQGLERRLGETPVGEAPEEGRKGLPIHYTHEVA